MGFYIKKAQNLPLFIIFFVSIAIVNLKSTIFTKIIEFE